LANSKIYSGHSGPKEKHEPGSQLYPLNFPIKPGHIPKDFRKWTNGAPVNLCLSNLPKLDPNTQLLSFKSVTIISTSYPLFGMGSGLKKLLLMALDALP
jgi:hypothetical protein